MKPAGMGREQPSSVELRRAMPVSTARVFEAWTDPDLVRQWMCPDPTVRIVELDWAPAVGVAYGIGMDVGGELVRFSGRFLEVVPDERLVFTWTSARTQDQVTRVTVEIVPMAGGSEVRLLHEELPTEGAAAEHRAGWENILARLAGHLVHEPG